jgi:hypothetical protein
VLMSCHYVTLLILTYRDRFPLMTPTFPTTGTDACEDLFSSLGSFVENKRVYTLLDGLQTIRSQLWASETAMSHNIDTRGRRRTRAKVPWSESNVPWDGPGNYPTDLQARAAWLTGVRDGRVWATACEMKPNQIRGHYPEWWTYPHVNDKISMPARDNEDEDENAPNEDNPGDAADEGDEEQKAGDEDDDDADEPGPNEDEDALIDMGVVLGEAEALIDESTVYMNVPGVGPKHIKTIMKWLNDDVSKLSADRTLRVQQNMHGVDGPANNAAAARDILVDSWRVGRGDDIAVKFNTGTEEHPHYQACLGRIIRMRKRGATKRWLDYRYPVDLAGARAWLGELYVTCHWYKRTRADRTYTYNTANMVQIHVETIVCPVNMTYVPESDKYEIGAAEMNIINTALRGDVDINL